MSEERNVYLEALRVKLRIPTSRGPLSVEDLFDLPLTKLNTIAKALNKRVKDAGEEDFLDEVASVDKELELQFAVVKDILLTKKAERDAEKRKAEIKAKEQELLALIDEKKKEEQKGKPVEELMAELAALRDK